MLRRIGFWALAGCVVALIWAVVFYLAGPSMGWYPSQGAVLHHLGHNLVLPVTVPAALLGRHYAITWYWSAVINAGIYACFGLAVEMLRRAVPHGWLRLHH